MGAANVVLLNKHTPAGFNQRAAYPNRDNLRRSTLQEQV